MYSEVERVRRRIKIKMGVYNITCALIILICFVVICIRPIDKVCDIRNETATVIDKNVKKLSLVDARRKLRRMSIGSSSSNLQSSTTNIKFLSYYENQKYCHFVGCCSHFAYRRAGFGLHQPFGGQKCHHRW